jgi:hypothetical protein
MGIPFFATRLGRAKLLLHVKLYDRASKAPVGRLPHGERLFTSAAHSCIMQE